MSLNHGKRILVICPYPERTAPSQRLKYEQYVRSWEEAGFSVTVSPFMTSRFMSIVYQKGKVAEKILWTLFGYLSRLCDLARIGRYDVVYVHQWVAPFGPPAFEGLTRRLSRSLVYDIDDLIHTRVTERVNANWFTSWLKSPSRVFYLLRHADHVVVPNETLADLARRLNPTVTVIPPTLDFERFQPGKRPSNERPLVIGWTGSHSTSRWLPLVRGALLELRREIDFRVLLIGDPSYRLEGLEDVTTSISWREESEVEDLQRIDIGLYPLPNDDPWVLGKSALKAITYMALGIPAVASDVGANRRVIEHEITGFLVQTPDDWKAAIRRLAGDPRLRGRVGRRARSKAEALYSLRANTPRYLDVIRSALASEARLLSDPGPGSRSPGRRVVARGGEFV